MTPRDSVCQKKGCCSFSYYSSYIPWFPAFSKCYPGILLNHQKCLGNINFILTEIPPLSYDLVWSPWPKGDIFSATFIDIKLCWWHFLCLSSKNPCCKFLLGCRDTKTCNTHKLVYNKTSMCFSVFRKMKRR